MESRIKNDFAVFNLNRNFRNFMDELIKKMRKYSQQNYAMKFHINIDRDFQNDIL